ncbi:MULTISPECIES: polysaccharide biosynthesis/export family protein [Vibrio]|uniref:polysaccharide biosynthesis/export family protein n=1 Tax=Vibrio TaxID=662 RepID=UPI00118136E5|nr:polysaccharide biosynthesis/export family protein [Vibrio furnissii]MCG6268414.1 polysaccharide export protein [Vibrio furnissii]TRN25107.1 capsular biosynthesis protein [Vibrio furnissii]WHR54001.1 polysaccharide export protein [Vibrio furnissii]
MRALVIAWLSLMWLVVSPVSAQETPSPSAQSVDDAPARELQDYHLGTGDMIDIIVHGEPDMSMKLKISKAGVVNFPYIGEITLTGKTPSEVEADIENRLRGDYLLNPMVTVNLAEFRKIYVSGEVEQPNGYEYQPNLTVEQAIALAGGFTDRADRKDINIRVASNHELIKKVELTHLIQPGDTIIVEQSFF